MNRRSLVATLALLATVAPSQGSAAEQSNALYRWDPALPRTPYVDVFGQPQSLVTDLNTGLPIVDYLGVGNWANSPSPRAVVSNVITATPVGNALLPRGTPTDNAADVLVINAASLPAGTLSAFQVWNQSGPNGLVFHAYVLRPTAAPDTYDVVYDSGPLTLLGAAGQVESFPAGVAVQAGDRIAHYGQGIPLDIGAGTGLDTTVYPFAPAPVVGPASLVATGATCGPGNPGPCGDRTYSFGASVDVITGTTTTLVGGMRKFVDGLPGLTAAGANDRGQYIPVAVPDTASYPGSDYYELELGEYKEQLHRDLPPTTLRGYRQTNTTDATVNKFHYLGPVIVAQKDRPVRVKFTNRLPTGAAGKLWLPVDDTVMGAGTGPLTAAGAACDNTVPGNACARYTENRATLHLHGGHTPWISDGTPHQWITPAGEVTPFKKGVSVFDVPDMPAQADGSQTFYWTNQQSARLMFYHDHAYGITRLNVYAGEAAGYVITDAVEQDLVNVKKVLPAPADTIPLIIQDKTFVDAETVLASDPTWRWGTGLPQDRDGAGPGVAVPAPVQGDLWYPHIYVPAQNPYDLSGANPYGRWHYGPWFWPPTTNITQPPVTNPYYAPVMGSPNYAPWQPPEMPGVPNPSTPGESFFDVAMVNGAAYPSVTVDPKAVRLRILNAANDRFWNLQLYVAADKNAPSAAGTTGAVLCDTAASLPANCTEVKMVPAAAGAFDTALYPTWPVDGREGGVPDPATQGPSFIQFASEGGLLPAPVVIPNQPVVWNANPTTFNFGNVSAKALLVAPAERADVVVDFSAFAGKTLILYNDAPAAFPALDNRYDYYTGNPDLRDAGGHEGTIAGYGPNTRTIMQIVVRAAPATPSDRTFTLAGLQAAFASTPGTLDGAFARAQDPIIVAQGDIEGRGAGLSAYDTAYGKTLGVDQFPFAFPYWGVSRIGDTSLSFAGIDGTLNPAYDPLNPPALVNGQLVGAKDMEPKAIQDEMGEVFDPDFGRMSSRLGLELRNTNAQNQNFVTQTYTDGPTEIISATLLADPKTDMNDAQIWKITHNGVDTHPVHFHLFEVQLINRVGWDGAIRLPDPNELGWKDTVRISPLEDTIVALRFVAPKTPFGIPYSVRPMSPATPLGSPMGLTNIDPFTGQPFAAVPVNNIVEFGWEYVWHCHILSHEEMDMMRAVVVTPAPPPALPVAPVLAAPAVDAGGLVVPAVLTWTDATPVVDPLAPANFGNPGNEIGFRVLRSVNDGPFAVLGVAPANVTTFTDATAVANGFYKYQVVAFSAVGDSGSNIQTVGQPLDVVPPTLAWGALSPAANVRGWNNTPVNVLFTAADNLSGVASVALAGNPAVTFTSPPGAVISTEGLNQSVTVVATDVAGNSATFTSPARNVDLTPSVLTATPSPVSRTRGNGTSGVTVSGTVKDALSGPLAIANLNEGTYTITSNKPALPGNNLTGTFNVNTNGTYSFNRSVSRVNTTPGPRIWTITVRAPDRAGNIGTTTTTYTVN